MSALPIVAQEFGKADTPKLPTATPDCLSWSAVMDIRGTLGSSCAATEPYEAAIETNNASAMTLSDFITVPFLSCRKRRFSTNCIKPNLSLHQYTALTDRLSPTPPSSKDRLVFDFAEKQNRSPLTLASSLLLPQIAKAPPYTAPLLFRAFLTA